jgi:proteic killer suppression protein
MITSFGSKETEKIWSGDCVKNMPPEILMIEKRILRMLNNSQNLIGLRIPPSNKPEKLSSKVINLYCIPINDQWRITFRLDDGLATENGLENTFVKT